LTDGGGFNGDTANKFCLRYPDYRKIFFFEPSYTNIKAARDMLRNQRDVEFIQMGLSNTLGTSYFDSHAGSASAISDHGSEKIDVTCLDQHISDTITFIKMDLEGWELLALRGAVNHIVRDHPTLAISVYHKAGDFWRIYEFVTQVRNDYKVYLRYYSEGWSETVMFFVPSHY